MTYKELVSQEKLSITTPYMLRNDGELLTCGEIHPYIKSYRKESLEETLKYLDLHKSFLKWFYNNSLNQETKSLIKNFDKTEKTINRLWYLTNQEFCRVRTSNYRYKIGGDNGEIYFRISSENFNWFDLIWNTCVKFIHSIDYVTIMKDPQTFGKQFDYIKIKGNKINKFPIKDFIELEGEPLIENKHLTEAHWGKGVDVDSLADDWLDNHWEDFVDGEVERILYSVDSLEELKEYYDLPENITSKEEAKKWLKDNVVNNRDYFNSEYYDEIAKEEVCKELDDLWDSAYDYFYGCCDEVVKKINKKILIEGVRFDFNISESRSISAGRWPSQYAEFRFRIDRDVEEDIENELDDFSCEIRFSDEHDNGQYCGEEINWLDYNNLENCDWKETIFRVISDELSNLDKEIYEKVFGDGLDNINLNEKLTESQVIKQPSFEHNYHYGRVWATNSSSEMANAIMNSTVALRILYDTKHKFYVYSDADGYIHRDLLEIAWEYGMYPEFQYRWQVKQGHFENHSYQLIYTPKDKISSTWGAEISQDGYTDRIEYDFGVITGRNDNQNVFLNKIPLIKLLKKYKIKHTYLDGWDGYTPIIKELTEELNAENLLESKEDKIKFTNIMGKDLSDRFFNLRNKLSSPYNDIYYWIKKGKWALIDYIDSYKSNNELKKITKVNGSTFLGNQLGYKVYEILNSSASCLLGKNTKWCITSSSDWNAPDFFWDKYTSNGERIFFFIGKDKYALRLFSNGCYQLYNDFDESCLNVNLPYSLIPVKLADMRLTSNKLSAEFGGISFKPTEDKHRYINTIDNETYIVFGGELDADPETVLHEMIETQIDRDVEVSSDEIEYCRQYLNEINLYDLWDTIDRKDAGHSNYVDEDNIFYCKESTLNELFYNINIKYYRDKNYKLTEELRDEVSSNTLKKRREYYLTHGLKNIFPIGIGENFDINTDIRYLEDDEGVFKDKNQRSFKVWDEQEGYGNQTNGTLIAYVGDNWIDNQDKIIKDNLLGILEYSVSDNKPDRVFIQNILIKDNERRKGIASVLLDILYKKYKKVDWGYTTDDGSKLYKAYIKEALTKEQEEYFKDSKIRDKDGNLLICYHGTTTPGFNEFNHDGGNSQFGNYKFGKYNVNFFATNKEVAKGYTDIGVERDGNIYYCYLNVVNPYIVNNETQDDVEKFIFRRWNNIKDKKIRDRQINKFNSFWRKWGNKSLGKGDVKYVNQDLAIFNVALISSLEREQDNSGYSRDENYYDLVTLGENTLYGGKHVLMYSYGLDEIFDADNYEEIRDHLVGDIDFEPEQYYLTTNDIIRFVLNMNEEEGTNYDGIIIPDIYDIGPTGSLLNDKTTDIITLKSSNQIKRIDNLKPTSSSKITEELKEIIYDNPVSGSSFITPKGKFVRVPGDSHRTIFEIEKYKDYKNLKKFCNDTGYIRINNGSILYWESYITLTEKEPTEAQYAALIKYLDYLFADNNNGGVSVDYLGDQDQFQHYEWDYVDSDDIIEKIRDLYKTGILKEYLDPVNFDDFNQYDDTNARNNFKNNKVENSNFIKENLTTNNVISLLSNTFGTTDEPQPTAMYILPDGRFLFTTPLEPNDECDYEIDEHRNIDDFLYHKDIIEEDRYLEDDGSLFTENILNCIRFNITDDYYGNYSYIQLNKKQPTPQQYDALLKIFDYVINHRYKYLSIIFNTQYGKQIKLELNNYTSDELLKKIKRYYVSGIITENKNKQLTLQDIFPYTDKTESEKNKNKNFYSLESNNDLWEIVKEFENDLVLIVSSNGKKEVVDRKELTLISNSLLNDKEVVIKDELFDFIDNCIEELYNIKQSNPKEINFLKLAFSELKEAKIPIGYRYARVEKNKIYCFRKPKGSSGALRVFFFIKNNKIVCFKAWLKGSKIEENKIIQEGNKKYLNYN